MSQVNKCVVYAFAHAGANVTTYSNWVNLSSKDTELTLSPVERPGRGKLSGQSEENNLSSLVALLAKKIYHDFNEKKHEGFTEWATFGHSFGGTLSVAVAQKLVQSYQMKPRLSVVSGSVAPCMQKAENLNELSDEEIVDKLRADQGTPEAILNEPLLVGPIIRQLRNDYVLKAQFHELATLKVKHPMALISAKNDIEIPLESIAAWQHHSEYSTITEIIDGGHFAVYQNWDVVRRALTQNGAVAAIRQYPKARNVTYDYELS